MAENYVELRSDTFTRPTAAMRKAMAEAEVGDDVFGEDPTINALQARCAELFGKEAALYVASGTMGNEVAIKALTNPGDEVVLEEHAHIANHELSAPATISGVLLRTVPGTRGILDPDDVAVAIRPRDTLFSYTTLVCLENTHQAGGGTVWPLDAVRAVAKVARDRDCAVYMDGARVFNASVASGIPVSEYAAEVDALSFCFSKGLAAPVGSMLVGSAEFVRKATRVRRMLGGGWRQAGVLAAAARVALDSMVDRLAEDHANARRLAEALAEILTGSVDPKDVETNIVFVGLAERNALEVTGRLWEQGVRVLPYGEHTVRCVTHYEVDAAGVDRAIAAFRDVLV